MTDEILLSSDRGVTLVGGAETSAAGLAEALSLAPVLVAADGGADAALAAGHKPVTVIGDMDSLSDAARRRLAGRLHEVSEQQSTDFDKALRHVAAPFVIGTGFLGGRLDHELAALSVLMARPDRICVLTSPDSLVFLCPPEVHLTLPEGLSLSLFPLAPCSCASTGLLWPTEGLTFAPGGRIGTSNAVTGPVTLRPSAPALLVILPRESLEVAVRSLAGPAGGSRWPAPAR